jgi:hypothetical protein
MTGVFYFVLLSICVCKLFGGQIRELVTHDKMHPHFSAVGTDHGR